MTTETTAQANIRLGRDLASLPPETRLEWHYAGEVKDTEPAPLDDGMTDAARSWLADMDPAALNPEMRQQFEWLNTDPAFRTKATVEESKPATTFALSLAKMQAAGLTPQRMMETDEAFQRAKTGLAEKREGKHPSLRTVRDAELDGIMLRIRPFLEGEQ